MIQLPSAQEAITMIPGVVMGFTFHEFAHAWTATWFGDDTPRRLGRVSLNPMVHLDLLGTLLLFLGGPGWAKPVPVDLTRVRPRVFGDIVISLAGVIMNFLLALLFLFLTYLAQYGQPLGRNIPELSMTLFYVYRFNILLVAFNLIPLPPLDGFRVVRYLLPERIADGLYRMGPIFLMLLFFTGATDYFFPQMVGALGDAVGNIAAPLARLVLR